jgi:hypothetical protein
VFPFIDEFPRSNFMCDVKNLISFPNSTIVVLLLNGFQVLCENVKSISQQAKKPYHFKNFPSQIFVQKKYSYGISCTRKVDYGDVGYCSVCH